MVLYRVISELELKERMGVKVDKFLFPGYSVGSNTFKYEREVEYIHFFRYAQHANINMNKFGVIIAQFEIPDEFIEEAGYGFYSYSYKDFCTTVPIPECIIKKENFSVDFINGFKTDLTVGWCYPNGEIRYSYMDLYHEVLMELYRDYKKNKVQKSFSYFAAGELEGLDIENFLLDKGNSMCEEKNKTRKFSKYKN